MFSSRFSPSTRTFADAVRNSRSPSPAGDGAAPVDAAVASPDVPRVAIFEANTKDIKSDVEFKGRTYAIEGVVTKYGNYLIAANTWGALASGKDKTTKDAKTIGSKLFNHLAGRVDTLKHNENQLNAHLEVILPFSYAILPLCALLILFYLQDLTSYLVYKHENVIFLTYKGVRTALQATENPHAKEHRRDLLALFKSIAATARNSIKVRCAPKGHKRQSPASPVPPYTELVNFWASTTPSDTDYALTIESFFSHPQLVDIYLRMLGIEQTWQNDDMSNLCANPHPGVRVGYVYVAKNRFFGPLHKIGATMRTPQIRVRELAGAGVPEPFEIVASIPSTNPFALEREIHAHYDSVRKYGMKKEFFLVDEDDVVAYFHALAVRAMAMPPKVPRGEPTQTKIKRLRKMYLNAQARAAKLQAEMLASKAGVDN